MKREAGILNPLILPIIILGLLAGGLGAFGFWAYTQMQDYKTNSDQKVSTAVRAAETEKTKTLQAEFAEIEKQPTRKFTGPEQLGTVSFAYPKTWSVFVERNINNTYEAYFHPAVVPPLSSGTPYALRLSIATRSYSEAVKRYEPLVKKGDLTAKPVKLQSGEGIRIDGLFEKNIEGSMIIFPLRDKTVQIYTQSKDYVGDFNDIMLPSLTFVP